MSITEALLIILLFATHAIYYKLGRDIGYRGAIKDYFGELLGDCPPPNPQKEAKE